MKIPSVKVPGEARSLWQEFKSFAFKGSMVDLAIAVVIGKAFGDLITSLVNHIIMPGLSYVTPGLRYTEWKIGRVEIGNFIGDLVNFLLIAATIFLLMVKLLQAIQRVTSQSAPSDPTTKECPLCLSVIPFKARKCAHCTADLPTPVQGGASAP